MYIRFAERAATLEIKAYTHAIKRTLRKAGALARNEVAVGLIAPPDVDIENYTDALKSVLEATKRDKIYGCCTITVSYKGKVDWTPATDLLKSKPGVIVLMPNGVSVPNDVRVSFDEVIPVPSLTPHDLAAAIKEFSEIPTTIAEAKALLAFPLDLLFLALRPGRSVSHALARLSALDKDEAEVETQPREIGVEKLSGFGAAKEWALELAEDIRDWSNGAIEWRDVDCGLLISGPPGTGKTMFAEAVAKTCGMSFLSASCAQWQTEGNLSDFLRAMKKSFADATEKAPCVLFLDEFDAVGDRTKLEGHNASYGIQVINALLEALDGSKRRDGVVVIAATNYPDEIDPAIRRPGRLDRHVAIELPGLESRMDILTMHLGVEMPPDVLDRAARATHGYSGAALAQLAKDVRKKARRARRSLTADDLKAATPPMIVLDPDIRLASCVHESGHAVVGTELGFGKVEVIAVLAEIGLSADSGGYVAWLRQDRGHRPKESYYNEVAMFLAGRAAEEVILDRVSDGAGGGKGSDLHRATDVATLIEASLGFGQALYYSNVNSSRELEELRRADPVLRRRVEKLLGAELERAKEIVRRRRADVEGLAKVVMEKEMVNGNQVRDFLRA